VALLPTGFEGLAKLHPAADTAMGFHAVELDTLAAIMDVSVVSELNPKPSL